MYQRPYNPAMAMPHALPPRVLLGRILALRGLLGAGWALGLLLLGWGFGVVLPVTPLLVLLGLVALFALVTRLRLRLASPVTAGECLTHLYADLFAFSALVFFSGGVTNPFASLMLAPVVLAAISLSARPVWGLATAASAAYGVLLFNFVPLPITDPVMAYGMHLGGMWFNFVISAVLLAWFVTRAQANLRARERQLAELRERQLRDEGVLALGAQAALAAHELATPLATIATTAHELARDFAGDPEIGRDSALLEQQAAVCKGILDRLAARAHGEHPPAVRTLDAWLSDLQVRWGLLRPDARAELILPEHDAERRIAPPEALGQALLNLLNNAADVSPDAVCLAHVPGALFTLEIRDRGAGFSAAAQAEAGRRRYSEKPGRGLGVGLTLTHASVENLGGVVSVTPRAGGGSVVTVSLPWEAVTRHVT
jgi:two-component system sensor histidine kinase RegB